MSDTENFKDFDHIRETLILACEGVLSKNLNETEITVTGSWGPDDKAIEIVNRKTRNKEAFVSKPEWREMIQMFASHDKIIVASIIPRMLQISNSCKKITDQWYGTSSDFNEFRYIVERYASLISTINEIKTHLGGKKVTTWEDFVEISDICANHIGTRYNWYNGDSFEDMRESDYKIEPKEGRRNYTATNILKAIDKASKKDMKGLRHFYNFCCEFVHPNIGDSIASSSLSIAKGRDKSLLRVRKYYGLSKPKPKVGEIDNNDAKQILRAYEFFTKLIKDYIDKQPLLIEVVTRSRRIFRKGVHKMLRGENSILFNPSDLCPCGSGKSVKECKRYYK